MNYLVGEAGQLRARQQALHKGARVAHSQDGHPRVRMAGCRYQMGSQGCPEASYITTVLLPNKLTKINYKMMMYITWWVKQESSERESRRCTRARMWPTARTETLGSAWQAAATRWAARAAQRRPQIRRMRFRLSKAASMILCSVYTLQ